MLMKRFYLLAVMCLVTLMGFTPTLQAQTVWDGTADITWYDASQTSFDISTPEQLAGLAQLVNGGNSFNGKTLNLTADIWLNNTGDSTNNWVPIGGGSPTGESPTTGNAFKGNFNGHGYAIYNLYCDKGSTFHAGLFCALENPCTIDSLVMVNPVLKSRGMMGCVAGFPRGSSSVYVRYCLVINARIEGENTSGSNNIGGIFGATYPNSGSTYIQNCGVTGSITGHYPGGIAGNAERSYITNAYFAGDLFAYSTNYGGMTAHGGNRTNCYSYTQVLSSTTQSSASNDGTPVSQSEMQSANMITLLGSAFTMDFGINSGYPVMSFMAGITPATAEICLGESVTLTAHGLDSYLWSTGASTETTTVTPTATTTYTVSGTYKGMPATLSSVITVYPQAIVSAAVVAGSNGQVHGTVTPDTSYVTCMGSDVITLTVTPDAGYRIESVTLNGEEIYGDIFGPGMQVITVDPNGTLGTVKIYLSKCAIVTLPYMDDFESYASSQVPECYTKISTNSYPYAYSTTSYSHSGSKCIYTYMYNTSDNYMLVLPKMFDMNTYPMESLMVSFWARTSNINNSVTVGVMSDPNDVSTFTPVETFTFAATGVYDQFVAYLGNAAAGKSYIAFKYNCGSTYTYIYMDDITVDVAPTCSPVTHLTVDNIYGTNASLNWEPNVVGTTYDYLITVLDNATQITSTYTTTETSYVLMGLNEQTSYAVSVQSDCGGGDLGAAETVNFTTPCVAPIEVINNSYPTSTYSTEGNHFPTANHYVNSYTEQIYFPGDLDNTAAEFSGLSFQYNISTVITRTLDIYMAHTADTAFEQGVWATPLDSYVHVYSGPVSFNYNGPNRWVDIPFDTNFYYNGYDNLLLIVNDITGSSYNNSNSKFYTIDNPTYRSQCQYNNDANVNWGVNNKPTTGTLHTQVNNIRLTACDAVTCIAPNTLQLVYTDANSAEISWVNPNATQNFEIEYKAANDTDWTSTGTVSGTDYTISGLNQNTQYTIRVRAICSANDLSEWSETITLRTECDAIVNLPYTQNFDSDTYGSGTEAYLYCWDRLTTDPSKPVQIYPTNAAHTTPNAIRFYDGANVTNIAIMPKVDASIALNQLQLSFWVRSTSSTAPVILELGVMTDKSDATSFEILDTIPTPYLSGDMYTLVEYSLANYAGNGQYIAFRATKGNGGNNLRLDDVTLDYIPVCQHPVNLVVDSVSSETASIHWSEAGTATSWIVEYGLEGFTPGDGMVVNATDTVYTIYGLNPNTNYDVYVYADCGSNFISTPIDITLRTDCGPIAQLPFTEDFETGVYNTGVDNSSGQQDYIVCWSRLASDHAHNVYIPSSTTYSHSGSHYLDFHWTSNCYNIAIAPALDDSFDVSQLMVNFWASRTGSSGMLEVGVMSNKDVDSTFVPMDTIDLSAANTYAMVEQYVKFDQYQGTGKYIAFRVSNASSCGFYIDDVTIDYAPDCSPVQSVAVSEITGTSAVITWTPGVFGTVDSYTLEYSEGGMDNWTTIDNITATTYLLGGLDHSTYYDVRVKSNCDNGTSGDWVMETFRTNCLVGGDVTIGDGTSTNSYLPTYGFYNYSYTQQIFLATEMGAPKSIESVTFDMAAHVVDRNIKIYLMHTTESTNSSWIPASTAQLVYSGTPALQVGLNTFNFTTPFQYNGADNLALIVVDETGSYSSGNTWRTHTAPFGASRYVYQDGSPYGIASTPSSGYTTTSRNNVIFGSPCDTTTTCVAPHPTISSTTSDGAVVDWVAGYMENTWEMEYRPLSDTNWISIGTVTSAPVTITGLNPNKPYKVRMRSDCGGGEYSFWAEASFTTACGAFTVAQGNPWVESLENNPTMTCFDTPVTYTNGSNTYPKTLSYGNAAHSAPYTIEFKGTNNMLVLPEFTNDIHDLRMSFWATSWGVTTTAVVGVITDLADTSTFEPLMDAGTPGPRGGSGGGNGNFMGPFDFNNVQATSGRIAILFTGTTASDAGWNLDDFTVELIPSCSAPLHTSVTVDNVTDNSAEVSFMDEDPTHNAWVIYYGETGTSTDTWNAVSVSSTTGNLLSGLNSNTAYSVYVLTLCGGVEGDDVTNTVNFQTTTLPTSLPYTTDFEDPTDNNQWGIINGTQTNKWYIGAPTNTTSEVNTTIGGTNGLYISNDNGATNAYTGTETRVYAYRDVLVPDGTTELVLSFDWKAQGGLYNYEFLRVYWLDPTIVNLTAGNNPPSVNGVNYDAAGQPGNYGPNATEHWLSQHNTWQHQEMVISADQFPGMGVGDKVYRLAFHWRNTYYSSQPPAAVDNIELRAITCATPTGLAVSNVDENSATVSWVGNADSYGVTITSAAGTDYQTTTSNSLTLTGLNASTSYQVSVRAYCGTDSSMVSQSLSFATSCGAISVATTPWTSDFEGTDEQYLNCWVSAATGYRNGHTYPHIEPSAIISHAGSHALEVAFGNIVTALPLFVEDLSTLQISFWAKNNNYSSDNPVMELGYITNPNDSSTFVSLQTLTGTTYTETTRTFADLAGLNLPNTTRIAFRYVLPTSSSLSSWYIDDIEVSVADPADICYTPTNLAVAPASITQTSATATWTPGGTETSWNVAYKTAASTNWQAAVVSAPTYTMNNLTPGTAYVVRVQAVCDANETSAWTNDVAFTTEEQQQETCPAPTGLTATVDHTDVTLTWQQEPNTATEWQINYRLATESNWSTVTATSTTYTLTDLTANAQYVANVVAHCTNGLTSDESNTVTFETNNIGVEDYLNKAVTLYPNPATEMVSVAVSDANIMITGVEVYNVYGQLINTIVSTENPLRINVSGLADGMYYVRVTTDNGVVTKNFVKR